MIFDILKIPQYLRKGIRRNSQGKLNKVRIIGCDSETLEGEPLTLQFWSHENDLDIDIIKWTEGKKSADDFLRFLESLPADESQYILYCHNLSFDIVSFFYSKVEELLNEEVEFVYRGWNITGVYASTNFLFLKKGKQKTVLLIDTGAFLNGSLENLAKIFCPDLPKLKKPKGLGSKRFKKTDKHFRAYAMRDAEIAWYIGKYITDLHIEMDIKQTVSVPQMAGRIFRHTFMNKTIPLPPMKITYPALHSYHGGRNNLTVPKGKYKNIYVLDITSAYPYAMSTFPSFSNPKLYKGLKANKQIKEVPPFGIYKIKGYIRPCKYPIIFTHDFKPIFGDIDGIWTTGFELNSALKYKEFKVDSIDGYWYDAEEDKEPSPFKEYVAFFFKMKEQATDPIKRLFYKLLLNSLYGKFIQTNKRQKFEDIVYNIEDEKLYFNAVLEAGGLFNPFIATLITGHCRAYIHKLEHKYKSIHTATDSVFTYTKPKEKKGLGGLKIEAFGDIIIFRNKLYIMYDKKGKLIKYALHGFHGKVDLLEAMYKEGIYEYEYVKVNKLKESIRRGLQVNKFEIRESSLKL